MRVRKPRSGERCWRARLWHAQMPADARRGLGLRPRAGALPGTRMGRRKWCFEHLLCMTWSVS